MDFQRYINQKERIEARVDGEIVTKYRYAELVEKERKDGGPPLVYLKSEKPADSDSQNPYREYAMVERARINNKDEPEDTKLEVQSKIMQRILRSIIGKHSQIGTHGDPIKFKKPYYFLFHCRKELKAFAQKESTTPEEKQQLDWLNDFISNDLKDLEKIQTGLVDKGDIEFKHLPILFEPGSVVVARLNVNRNEEEGTEDLYHNTKRKECFLFHRIDDMSEGKDSGRKSITIELLRLGFHGSTFGLVKELVVINDFPDTQRITDLDCYPLKCLGEAEKDALIPGLIDRGRRWCQFVESQNLQYDGMALSPEQGTCSWDIRLAMKSMSGRVVVDAAAFNQAFPWFGTPLYNDGNDEDHERESETLATDGLATASNSWRFTSRTQIPKLGLWNCYHKKNRHKLNEAHFLLSPGTSVGYNLSRKEWGYFDVDSLQTIEWKENSIDRLEISPIQKGILMDLVAEHSIGEEAKEMAIGKGQGLIFLLHGPPGCGKTLTAELIAEEQKKSLVRITASDLGNWPGEVEKALGDLLKLALGVSAIVLIDEADTFLSKRAKGGAASSWTHNAIVALFLKHIEYFPGIIFLTTNLEEDIDPAVLSRVVPLRYGGLDAHGRAEIWKHHLARAERLPAATMFDAMCNQLGIDYALDGREIKTLSNLALTICRKRKTELSIMDIQQLFELTYGTSKIGADGAES